MKYYPNDLTSITSHSYNIFCVIRTFKIYSLINFQISNRVLLTTSPWFHYIPRIVELLIGSLYPLPAYEAISLALRGFG